MKKAWLVMYLVFLFLVLTACASSAGNEPEPNEVENVKEDDNAYEADPALEVPNEELSQPPLKGDEQFRPDMSNNEQSEISEPVLEEPILEEPILEEPILEAPIEGPTLDEPALGFVSPYHFEYPDAVRGIYVTGSTVGVDRFNRLLDLVNSTPLNAMVIDIKEDHGYLTFRPDPQSPYHPFSKNYIRNVQQLMTTLEAHQIYPIARIVVFKDTVLAHERPEWSFLSNGEVWLNSRKEAFVNPFLKEVWDYNIEVAKMAAELGFREIQFDYVRFPEGFERRDLTLQYQMGDYQVDLTQEEQVAKRELGQARVQAITDFVARAKEALTPYGVDVSVDIFGYTATIEEALGIGQNFIKISEHVDVISSMIYPSHWTNNYFGIPRPDTEPYLLVQAYVEAENKKLALMENPPISRPWIQDFTASWLGSGNYIKYGKAEVEAQIRALNEGGIWEFLLWNPVNRYSESVNYLPISPVEKED